MFSGGVKRRVGVVAAWACIGAFPALAVEEGARIQAVAPTGDGLGIVVTLERGGPWQLETADDGCLLRFPGGAGPAGEASPLPGVGVGHVVHGTSAGGDYEIRMSGRSCRLQQIRAGKGSLVVGLAPAASVSTMGADSYRIGVGDQVKVGVFGQPDLDRELRVDQSGSITFPYLGSIPAAGRTPKEVASEIETRLGKDYIVNPQVVVEITDYKSQWVNVSGQVENPGRHYLRGKTTVVDAIALAGGLRKEAGTPIRVMRATPGGGESVITIGRDALYLSDASALNIELVSGDSIVVPSQEHFYIKGAVKNPGEYALNEGTTILRAISLAGGFDEYANPKKIELLRQREGDTQKLVLNVQRIENRKDEDVRILPGDIINVPARFL